ncbi:hypothetical protein A6F68_01142 [Tsuneonella dongtanensis]|uniref:DUF4136 domain-containing protein n=1 Tax=Tsuneonella dongtanensis TaxID=692370 RepID=A0A1B2ABX2_9SPHN|nr:DUF4136 domain-containing protein [Tsuneonella dongtanensis]ANY19660.1 hypothetical protein A6F68_01142 [Tsuneonella dongtanensis]
MSILTNWSRTLKLIAAPLALGALAACATPFNANVQRFQSALPAPQGQTFAVVADDPALAGGLEFAQYADYVENNLTRLGYTQAASPEAADLLVRFDYGIDKGRERVRRTGFYDPFYDPWYGYGRIGYSRFGYWGPSYHRRGFYGRSPWSYGFYDPFFDNGLDVYTVYTSGIEMKIDRRATGERLFEGKAEALSTSSRLQYLVPNLVEAMFTDFPGRSGETKRISVAPENMPVQRNSKR